MRWGFLAGVLVSAAAAAVVACGSPSGGDPLSADASSTFQSASLGLPAITCSGNTTPCADRLCCQPGTVCVVAQVLCLPACTPGSDGGPDGGGCTSGLYCDPTDMACLPQGAAGASCGTGDMCASGFCVSGICCATACAGACQTCGSGTCTNVASGTPCGTYVCTGTSGICPTSCTGDGDCASESFCVGGTCTPPRTAGVCTEDADCSGGHCVDGVCCDGACTGQCEACDEPGLVGTCSPVTGMPRGSRAPCAGAGADPCSAEACDGVNTTACAFVGASVSCRVPTCSGAMAVPGASCDGTGTCPAPVDQACAPYVCNPAADGCQSACASPGDCIAGASCVDGACVAAAATCDGEHTTTGSNGTTVDCAPYKCQSDGTCKSSCASVSDCVEPDVCNESGRCIAPPSAGVGSSGGCAASRPAPGGAGWAWGVLLALGAGLRRRLQS